MTSQRVRQWLLMSCGVIAVALGIVGVFLPLLPTTPFLLLAAACFIRSSDKLYGWLINHRALGPYIRNYREQRATTRLAKVVTLVLLWSSISFSAFVVIESWPVRVILLLIAVAVTIHMLALKTVGAGESRSHD